VPQLALGPRSLSRRALSPSEVDPRNTCHLGGIPIPLRSVFSWRTVYTELGVIRRTMGERSTQTQTHTRTNTNIQDRATSLEGGPAFYPSTPAGLFFGIRGRGGDG